MMLKGKSNSWARLKLLLLVPVGFMALSVFASSEQKEVSVPPPPPPISKQTNEPLLQPEDKSIKLQKETKDEYGVYLSFTKMNEEGKKVIDGISIYGVGEKRAFEIAQEAIDKGKFEAATLVIITPRNERVSSNYVEKMKELFVRNNIKCKIVAPESDGDQNGNLAPPPPPPPPAPDADVVFNYKDGKEKEIVIYSQYFKDTNLIDRQFNKVYNDDITSVNISVYKKAPAGILDKVEKYLKDKIKYDVKYVVKEE